MSWPRIHDAPPKQGLDILRKQKEHQKGKKNIAQCKNGLAGNRTLDHSHADLREKMLLREYYTTKPQARLMNEGVAEMLRYIVTKLGLCVKRYKI